MFKRALTAATALFMVAQAATAETRVVVDSVPTPEEFAHILGIDMPAKPKTTLRMRGIKMHAEPQANQDVEAQIQKKWQTAEVNTAPAAPKPASTYETQATSASTVASTYSLPPQTNTSTTLTSDARIVAAPVNFELDSSEIPASFEQYLNNLAVVLRAPDAQDRVLVIAGHTDSLGAEDYNLGLSTRRANAVETYLMSRGVRRDQLISVGRGETQLLKGREGDHAVNRRVEFRIAG